MDDFMKTEKTNIHSGHRQRLTDLITNAGVDNVSNIQAVEFFLTYIFPRGDVNPLAHRLLDKYENFANIIDASVADLCTIKGISKQSAQKIKMFAEMVYLYSSSKLSTKTNLKNSGEFLDILEGMLRFQTSENLFIFAFNHSLALIGKRRFDLNLVREVGISPYQLYDFLSSTKASYIIVAHNHPGGKALPSADDHDAVLYIEQLLKNLDCKLIDSFIVGKDGIYSEKQSSYARIFATTDQITSIAQ